MVIRPPRDDELKDLVALLVAQLREHGNELSDDALAAAAAGMMRRPQRGEFLIARDAHGVVGFAALSYLWTLERGGLTAWLDELYVLPDRREHGVGAKMLEAVLAAARAAGALAVDLEIEADHARVASLYRRFGFKALSRARWALELDASAATIERTPPRELLGGCFCGALRYRIETVVDDVTHCHCGICRRTSGAAFVTWVTIPAASFGFTAGEPAALDSTPRARRTFCRICGTPLTFQYRATPESVDVTVGSLDDPNAIAPTAHIWTSSQLRWLHVEDDLPRHREGTPSPT